MSPRDAAVRMAVYDYFARTGKPPSITRVARDAACSVDEVRASYQALYSRRLLVPDGDAIRMAPPFSGVETPHRVSSGGIEYMANCAWDSFGIVAALGRPGIVRSSCGQALVPLVLELTGEPPAGDGWRFQVAVPASQWWADIVYT